MSDTRVIQGDCLDVLRTFEDGAFDAVITDPPYELDFMGKAWDRTGVAFRPEMWATILRVVKLGGYMLAMGGSRTYHRLACAVEDAGWLIRDCLMWVYGTGFPKGQGCLKPAYEPIILARRPGPKVLPLGVDECRVPCEGANPSIARRQGKPAGRPGEYGDTIVNRITPERYAEDRPGEALGRYPANVLHDGSDEVMEAFAEFGERQGMKPMPRGDFKNERVLASDQGINKYHREGRTDLNETIGYGDTGTAARFFYTAKASKSERGEGNAHPTVKPLALMRWMVRLVCPAGGVVLDPFAGSGSTLLAAQEEGRRAVGIEREPAYVSIINKRLEDANGPLFLNQDK